LLTAGFLSTLTVSCGGAHPTSPDPNAPRPPVDQSGFVQHTEGTVVHVPMGALTKWRRSVSLESLLHGTKRSPGERSWLMTPVISWVVQNDFAEFTRSTLQRMKEAAEQDYRRT
jgi:hypothetical protein